MLSLYVILDKQTDRHKDRRKPFKQYTPDLSMRGDKNKQGLCKKTKLGSWSDQGQLTCKVLQRLEENCGLLSTTS